MRVLVFLFLIGTALLAPPALAAPSMSCAAGAITWLRGTGAPHTPLLVSWHGRPVGGGSVNAAGHWAIPLMVGHERPGLYLVEVRSRNDHTLLGAFTCAVGGVTPTTAPALPTATPAPATQNVDRNGDGRVTCDDFTTQAEAKIALAAGYTNLDNDGDGIPCEGLPK